MKSCSLGFSAFACLLIFWAAFIRGVYQPSGDEISLLVHSARFFHPSPTEWITQGFRYYFQPYPDVWVPFTDFIRPIVNLTYFVNSVVWGRNWAAYLFANYLFIAGITTLVWTLCANMLRLRAPYSLLAAILTLCSPALTGGALCYPSCGSDPLAALLVLIAIVLFLRRELLLCWIVLLLASLTKETALFAPATVSIAVLSYRQDLPLRRRTVWSLLFLISPLLWAVLHWHAFGATSGIYALANSPQAFLLRLLHGLIRWPLAVGYVDRLPSHSLWVFLNSSSGALDLVFWALMLVFIGKYASFLYLSLRSRPQAAGDSFFTSIPATLSLFAVGSLGLPTLLSLPPRFGAVSAPLLIIVLLASLQAAKHRSYKVFLWTALAYATVAGAAVSAIQTRAEVLRGRSAWKTSREYVARIAQSRAPLLVIADDPAGGYVSNASIAAFAGFHGQIVRLADLDLRENCAAKIRVAIEAGDEAGATVRVQLPEGCGTLTFLGAGALDRLLDDRSPRFARHIAGLDITYRMQYAPGENSAVSMQATIQCSTNQQGAALLVFDAGHFYLFSPLGN